MRQNCQENGYILPRDQWICPVCESKGEIDLKPLDGGSMFCSGFLESSGEKKRCAAKFHWCPFFKETVLGEPMHYVEVSCIFRMAGFDGKYDAQSVVTIFPLVDPAAPNTHQGDAQIKTKLDD